MRLLPELVASTVLMAAAALPMLGMTGCTRTPANTGAMVALPPEPLPDLHRAGLTQQWSGQIKLDAGERVNKAWRVGASVYLATTDARIARFDAKNGLLMWSNGLGAANIHIFRPIEMKSQGTTAANGAGGSDVLVVTGGEVFSFNLGTGDDTRLPARLGLSVSSDPLVIGNTLCVGGAGAFYGLYLDHPDLRHWVVPARGDIFVGSPVAQDTDVLMASRKGLLWRIDTDDGSWQWKDRKTNGPVVAGLAADAGAVYVPCLDQRLYAFNANTGGELWETQLAGRLEETPLLAGNMVLVRSQENGLYGLARKNGEIKWNAPDVVSVATGTDENVWVFDNAGNIKSINLADGDVVATAPAPGVQMLVPNIVDKSIIVVSRGGMVGSYSQDSRRQ